MFVIIKYHGPASSDPDVLEAQTTSVQGSCFDNANAWEDPDFGPQCFDPQIAVHQAPSRDDDDDEDDDDDDDDD